MTTTIIKRVLFWITFVPLAIFMVTYGIFYAASTKIVELWWGWFDPKFHYWEGWCFEYEKRGYEFINDERGSRWEHSHERGKDIIF